MSDSTKNVLEALFDEKTIAVLKQLLSKKDIFYLRDLSRESNVSLATTYRIVQKLKDLGLVQKKQQDKYSIYELNRSSPLFEQIYTLILGIRPDPIELLKRKIAELSLELHITKDKKVFIIGDTSKSEAVNSITAEIEAETGIRIKYLLMSAEQFKQMQDMNLV